ncbi:glycosyltransferase WbuB [Tenacibaculum sp. E3R01]|uniref:glycosyltransferase family 4 protein n=1 Tax=Tenacibaculum sp. E3R01 TaxID=2267227 RepID=UPI000DE89AEF|nr:glycosyltransferase family 4 protein [Tenacibaculum sp. E3R01]RBW54266.1 glycosyltransferase WbuB [Tenacibaculum sp. E3R01]
MKILIVSQYFYPESFKVNDIAFDFAKKGHEVTVLTGKPNYPNGKFFEGYGFFGKREETINNVRVIRTPLFPRFNGGAKFLVINYLSFLFFSFFAVHFRVKGKYDVIFSHLPSPLTSAIPGIWLKRKFKAPLVLWVLDLWPESVSANSSIKGGVIFRNLEKVIQYIYDNSDKILVSSKTFKTSIIKTFNIREKDIVYFPNWAEDVFTQKLESNIVIPKLPNGFNVMFAGNIGDSQDFESILKAAEETKGKINWVLVGDGRKADWVKKEKVKRELHNVYILGRFPLEMMPKFFKQADAMLVSLKNEPTFALTIPAKVQAYMASEKIILGMLNGEGMELINDSGSGIAVRAGDFKGLSQKALVISELDMDRKKEMGNVSLEYYNENFSKNKLFDNLENILKKIRFE